MPHYRLFGVVCLFLSKVSFATDEGEPDLFELSLEELQQIQVNVASQTAESLNSVPSSVTIFTRSDIQQLGVDDLYQLLNFVPGIQVVTGERLTRIPKPQARGIALDNGYLLFLINGKRMNEISFGNANVYHPALPLDWVERVEVIRGPGSALYGSNAFMGVINVITRQDIAKSVQVSAGQYESHREGAYWSNGEMGVSLLQQNRGSANHSSDLGTINDPNQVTSASAWVHSNGGYFDIDWLDYRYPDNINLGGLSDLNHYQSSNLYARGGYKLQQKVFSLSGEITWIEHEVKSVGLPVPAGSVIGNSTLSNDFYDGPWWKTQTFKGEVRGGYSFLAHVLSGGLYAQEEKLTQAGTITNHMAANNAFAAPDDQYYLGQIQAFRHVDTFDSLKRSQTSWGGYAELRSEWMERLTSFAGARYDNIEKLGFAVTPRLSLVYQPVLNQRWRVQYGEAFRLPVLNELYSNDNVTVGNPDLKKEKVATLELEWQQQFSHSLVQVVWFQNQTEDFVVNTPSKSDPTVDTFSNAISERFEGAEFSWQQKIRPNLKLNMTHTHMLTSSSNGAFANYSSANIWYEQSRYSMGMSILQRSAVEANISDSETYKNGAYLLVGIHGHMKLSEQFTLSLLGDNIFDRKVTNFERRFDENQYDMPDSPQYFRIKAAVKF